MDFEWDETKREANLLKHGLDFEDAARLLRSDILRKMARTIGGEERWTAVGLLDGEFVSLIYTLRNGAVRVISFRRARRGERRDHHAAFGG